MELAMTEIIRHITQKDRAHARQLNNIWRMKKEPLGLTQVKAAKVLGIGQSAVSQYLTGRIALNTDMILAFAKILRCSPIEISPDLVEYLLEMESEMVWIKTEDKTPRSGQHVMFPFDKHVESGTYTRKDGFKTRTGRLVSDIVYWFPTPKIPRTPK